MEQRLVAHVSGAVQGVGFRDTTVRIARGLGSVTGYVRNLPDGRVEMVAEGEAEDLTSLLDQVQSEMGSYIRQASTRREAATGAFARFDVGW